MVPLQDPQNKSRAIKRIRWLWKEGVVEISGHAIQRMQQRGLDIHDIQNVIERGSISKIERPHILWRYKISGKSVEGKSVACVVEINGKMVVFTVMTVTRTRKK